MALEVPEPGCKPRRLCVSGVASLDYYVGARIRQGQDTL
jgi:hypothetical protein